MEFDITGNSCINTSERVQATTHADLHEGAAQFGYPSRKTGRTRDLWLAIYDQQEQWCDVAYYHRREEYNGSRFDDNPSLEELSKYAREILQNDSGFKGKKDRIIRNLKIL